MKKPYRTSLMLLFLFTVPVIFLSLEGNYNPGLEMDVPFTQMCDYHARTEYGWPFPFWRNYEEIEFNTLEQKIEITPLVINLIVWAGFTLLSFVPVIINKFLKTRKENL